MPLDLWLTFVTASIVLLMIPGPTILLVLSYALSKGRSVALAYALLADRLRRTIGRASVITGLTRTGGAALVAMGVGTAVLRRPV